MHDLGPYEHILGLNIQGDLGPFTSYTSRRRKFVIYERAPPLSSPSPPQELIREYFRDAATQWRNTTAANRNNWLRAAQAANLYISGYCLWTYFIRTRDTQLIAKISAQTGIPLILPS